MEKTPWTISYCPRVYIRLADLCTRVHWLSTGCVRLTHPRTPPLRVSGQRTSLFLRFRSTARDGLLLWRGDSATRFSSDFLSLGLQGGGLVFRSGPWCCGVRGVANWAGWSRLVTSLSVFLQLQLGQRCCHGDSKWDI